jgi:hypothetical protein
VADEYNPVQHSIVQAMTGVWCRYNVGDFVEALFMAILKEIERVHWNVYQHRWGPSWHSDQVEDPMIPGISFTRYYDGCKCEDEDEHRPDCRHAKPNFQHEDVQFRWYKYPGRGMSTNKDWTADEWRAWFQRCLDTVRSFDDSDYSEDAYARRKLLAGALRERYPDVFNDVPDQKAQAMFRMMDAFQSLDDAQTPCWKCSEAGVFGQSGGGTFEGGKYGCVARTLHEDDDPDGACCNCGHVNADEQTTALEERRRMNSDEMRRACAADEPTQTDGAVGEAFE